jgi:uncharacterized protein YfaS (alpha-2-macroglobulin family)
MKKSLCLVTLISLASVLIFLSCGQKKEEAQKAPQKQEQVEIPVPVSPLQIVSYGPTGESQGAVQIQIQFAKPLIPLTTLSDADRKSLLQHFVLQPDIAGVFRPLGTSAVVFEPAHSLPMATTFQVTITQGLRNLSGDELEENFSWQFQTPLPQIEISPSNGRDHIRIDAEIRIISTMALDTQSLQQHIEFSETLSKEPIAYRFSESDRNPRDDQDIGMHRMRFEYILDPRRDLRRNTQYTVTIHPGMMTARGNRPTEGAVISNFVTYPPFLFLRTGFCSRGCGRKLTTEPYLAFSNTPDLRKLEGGLTIEPQTERWPFGQHGCESYSLAVNDLYLEPNSTYTITLHPSLTDNYGQEIENPQTVTFTTGDLTPQMWGPRGYQIVTPNIEPQLGIKTVNINTVFYKLLSLRPQDVLIRNRLDQQYFIEKLISEIKSQERRMDISLNEFGVGQSFFDLRPLLRDGRFGAVAYTFRSPTVQCHKQPIEFNGLILRTDLGLYTQFHPTGGIVKLNRLSDGQPIPGATVRIYREDDLPRLDKIWDLISDRGGIDKKPCFQGVTDGDGLLQLASQEMARCTKRKVRAKILNELYPPEADPDDVLYDQNRYGFAEPPRLLIVAEKDEDWTFLQTSKGGMPSIWRFGVAADWEAERPLSCGTIFSDQYLYRPGDTVKMKGISRYLLYGRLLTGQGLEYSIKLRDPNGAEKQIDTVRVNEFGTFHFEVPTTEGQPLGTYHVVAQSPHENLEFHGRFRLAEFRVPEFQVSMEIDKTIALPQEPIEISWEGRYYFGAPMSQAGASLNITRRRTTFRPPGWEDFSFGIPEYLEDKKVSLSGEYLQESMPLDEEGAGRKTIRLRREDIPFPMTYLCDVEVEDVSKQTVSANKSLTLLPDRRLIGLKLSPWIVARKDTVTVSLITTSPQGEVLTGVPLQVKLIRREYHSVKTETPDGRFRVERTVVNTEVDAARIDSGSEPVQVRFVPPTAGSYAILAQLRDRPEGGTGAARSLWVAGPEYVPWEEKGDDKLDIIMNKESYQVGDEATVFIQSPFPQAELFITVNREQIFLQDIKRIEGSGYTYRFTVTEQMLPNAYVTAALCRLGEPIVPVEEEIGRHMVRIGIADFAVSLSEKYLDVAVLPSSKRARPGEELTVDIQVTDAQKLGRRSELTVMVVDQGVLSLTGYSPPDLVKVVHRHRGYSGRINDNRPFVIAEAQLLQKGVGYGGGTMEGLTGLRVREKFLKLAYYHPSLVTDEMGRASFRFKLPDNLTTWRIMVVAVDREDLFGYGDETVIATQPFILRAVLPRFARLGDHFLSGVAVTNLTEAPGEIDVHAEVSGKSITLENPSGKMSGIGIRPGESKAVLFPLVAAQAGESMLTFAASFQGTYQGEKITETDALQVPLDIQDVMATETVVAVGETKERDRQHIRIADGVRMDTGGLNIVLSSTALTNIGQGASYLVNYPYGCLEQTLSRLLALIQLKYLSEKYGFQLQAAKPVQDVIDANIRKVLLMQHTDGGFKFWPSAERSDCYLSPYAARLFHRCRQLGYPIPDEVTERLAKFLDQSLRHPCRKFLTWKALAEYRINILTGLHHLGKRDETYFEEYYHRRNDLSYGAQIELAHLLFQSPSWRQEAAIMLREIKNGMFVTAQTAHFESPRELPPSWMYLYSPIITTARASQLFLEMEPESEYIAKFTRYILDARKNGRWRNTYENAAAIDALVDISMGREAESPDYAATVRIAGSEILKHQFEDHLYEPYEQFIPIDQLPSGSSQVDISKDGRGILYYILSYSYRLKGLQPARQEGFIIRRRVKDTQTGKEVVSYEDHPAPEATVEAGDVLQVELEFSVPQTGYHLVIDDPIPAGLEAIDASLKTTSTRYETPSGRRVTQGSDMAYAYWAQPIHHTELRDDRVALFADAARPGIYRYRYLLRATTPGTFLWPGARIFLMYQPEQLGTCAEGRVRIAE